MGIQQPFTAQGVAPRASTYDRYLIETAGSITRAGTVYPLDWSPLDMPLPNDIDEAARTIALNADADDSMSSIRCTRINCVSGRCEDATAELLEAFDRCRVPGICITQGRDYWGVRRYGLLHD